MMKSAIITLSILSILSSNIYAASAQHLSANIGSQTVMQTSSSPAAQNQKVGEAFLAANKIKPGVVTLPDGLQYKVLVEGNGQKPTDRDTVVVHYVGTLINGTEFDSSYKGGEPASFPVNAVIPGWVEALKLMKTGSTWELYIPSSLAYGTYGAPPAIGPNETLIFKVQLLGIKK